MASRVTSRDVQEIVSKLSSEKAKARDEGIKLLQTWLEGERSFGFCRYLSEKSSVLKANEIPHSETWAFLVKILIQCLKLEISSSKKRLPKLIFAKTFRIVVQRAQVDRSSGNSLPLAPVARFLFNHLWDVLKDVPSFQSEYGVILRHLLAVPDYRFHMRRRVYSNLVILYMEKVETSFSAEIIGQSNPKEEVFRHTLTFQSLLENPPGDIPNELREDMIMGFIKIFSHVRDEGKISRKLIECINTYLLKDGPNLGSKSLELHEAVHRFVFRCWFATHDRTLKDALVLYARLQLSLTRGLADGSTLLKQLLDVVVKELDLMSSSSLNITRSDLVRDENILTSSQLRMVELAAFVFCRACSNSSKVPTDEKRARQEHASIQIKERLVEGKWAWHAAVCCLTRSYSTRMKKDLFVYWFESISINFERMINNVKLDCFDGLFWTLRSLLRLSMLLPHAAHISDSSTKYPSTRNKVEKGWHVIWSCLVRSLPALVNITPIVDAALVLLCNIMLCDTKDSYFVSTEIWDLPVFKRLPSISILCFVSCYFSRRVSQGDPRDALLLRRNMLRTSLDFLNSKESFPLKEQLLAAVPATAYSLCVGSAPLITETQGFLPIYVLEAMEEGTKEVEQSYEKLYEFFDCSVEVLAKFENDSCPKINFVENKQIRLPRKLRDQLADELENSVLECIKDKNVNHLLISEVINMCALISHFMYWSYSTRIREDISPFFLKLGESLLDFLEHAVSAVEKTDNDTISGCLGLNSIFSNRGLTVASFKSFIRSPLLSKWQGKEDTTAGLYACIVESMERLLKSLAKLFEGCSGYRKNLHPNIVIPGQLEIRSVDDDAPRNHSKNLLSDMELDWSSGSSDANVLSIDDDPAPGVSTSLVNQKLDFLLMLSSFFSILPSVTWEVLYNLLEKESDPKVYGNLLSALCQHPHWSSSIQLSNLVKSLAEFLNMGDNLRLHCSYILVGICSLVGSLLLFNERGKHDIATKSSRGTVSEECLISLGDLMNKIFENCILDWCDRSKLVDCMCNFVSLRPQIAQSMIEKLFILLRDPDYRVRFCLARRIGVLFQTWDGHFELFQDICSNFGVKLVVYSMEKVVRAQEVLAAGPQPSPIMETAIVTLMHLALHSEKIELQAVFAICVVAAIEPSQRELICCALDSLSSKLQYMNRAKYMEELMGRIIFCWVACSVSLVSLVETRDLYVANIEPKNFIQYCCQWLLPALVLEEEASSIKWIAKIACQPYADLCRDYFVHIFSICMALHCDKKAMQHKGSRALETSILKFADISEHERDELIKKRMVSIVNHTLSLASNVIDPPSPYFSKDTITSAIQNVVDGFLDSDDPPDSCALVDKINIFRADRVFMFIVDIHYKVTSAAHPRHKSNHLAAIELLVNLLGYRAAIPSTFNYLLNLICQLIDCHPLMDQCCCIISTLLKISRENPSMETTRALGEQLQFLVSKLVACCTASESSEILSATASSQVVLLLQQLTTGSDSSLYEYIQELEPLPELDIFNDLRSFHQKICKTYSPKAHLLSFVKRSQYVPPRLLLCTLKALHARMFTKGKHLGKVPDQKFLNDENWHSDNEIVQATWGLIRICSLDNTDHLGALISDFISRVGISDPHRVVFHLPGSKAASAADSHTHLVSGISNEVLAVLMRLLKKYLMDDSVDLIDMASQALRGILSTEKGQQSLLQLDSYERSLIEVHSKGASLEVVQSLIANLQKKYSAKAISIEDAAVWTTVDKAFDAWICPLVYALIGFCDDPILRLCQDIVLEKSEVAELLFSNVFVNIAGKQDSDGLCKVISLKVQESVLVESNTLTKSVQVFLSALNELRLCYVMERMESSAALHKMKSSNTKHNKSHGFGTRSASAKSRDLESPSSSMPSTLLWEKVYWLAVDYLVVAKSAIDCGSYFTAFLYVEHWCEEHFNSLTLGSPDFSHHDTLPSHAEILMLAVTQINEPDSLYGIIQSHKLTSQIVTFEHEGNWSKALEYYDLEVRSNTMTQVGGSTCSSIESSQQANHTSFHDADHDVIRKKPYKGLIRSLQQIGCTHVLDVYCQGLSSQRGQFQHDLEFNELQFEAAWRAGNWDFCSLYSSVDAPIVNEFGNGHHFNENLHSCLRALQEGDLYEFHTALNDSKQALLTSICHASKESTEYIYSTVVKLQIFYHLGMAWDLRWSTSCDNFDSSCRHDLLAEPVVPSSDKWLHANWISILKQTDLHMNLLEPFIAFRRVLLQVLNSMDSKVRYLWESASILRKGSRISQAAAALHEFKFLCSDMGEEYSKLYWLGRLEEAKLLRAQGQHEMAINLADYISQNHQVQEEAPDVFRLVGKWLAETRSSNSRTILDKYLKHAVNLAEGYKATDKVSVEKRNQMHFHLAHYADALFRSQEERLSSNEWQVAMRLRKHKKKELEALFKRYKRMAKGDKTDYSFKIQELQKQLSIDRVEEEKLQEDRDHFLSTALKGYKQCLILGEKYDVQAVFRLVSLWFSLSTRQIVVDSMLNTVQEVQSYKFILLVYQIASRMGSTKESDGPTSFQYALLSLLKKMALDHPYHTIFQLLALANGDRIKDKQRSRNSFVVDMDKKIAAEDLLRELSAHHGSIIKQMKQLVEIYIKLAEMETKKEDTNKRVTLPRELRSVRELELVPVITSNIPIDRTCQYPEGFFPHFKGLGDSVTIMNGINAPKVVECTGSDGNKYRQLAKSGNDDLRQDAVMEQFFGLVNTFLQNNRDTWRRRLRIRTYKVVPFTPCAGVLEWVNGTFPLGEYLIGSSRNGGAHGRYGVGDWTFMECRQKMAAEANKLKAFQEVCQKFRPVMHHFFLERFSDPADWFDKRLAYTRSVAASSMVGYIVGLGDRHSMNILIDQATAEVVHIDLGVAFDQGLMLKTPERVPFRLTRDIIDGMGVTGVEGVFRRCCEATLSVMRANKEALLTIIEVFIHDPLYKWALSPLKAMQRQKDIDDDLYASLEDSEEDGYEGNKDATRALLRIKQKLDGYEDGEMRSVHGQVQQLIQDAIDPDRLCQLFPGWGAWL
ncbi:serine/threonine-protein kinase ATM isoform X2 [Andrographis paniculata]|uniref:serine/threonine-protein kinase ATM isoform X2 n=1 Tax=Andrographis paniculata TaxID=175694 RepID=UPI0021E76AE1|nr:serine/threonine-protein kinase ATM isoform X2 [Andrographis paniculata]